LGRPARRLAGVKSIGRKGYRYKKSRRRAARSPSGVGGAGRAVRQGGQPAPRRADAAIDRLNLRFGRDTVSFAAAGRRRPWKLRREFLSPCYTTASDELLRA
jgi:DNA polymerase V